MARHLISAGADMEARNWVLIYGADHHSCTGGARITTEGGSLKRDLRAGSVCMSVCLSVRNARYCDVT